ncbi:MAG: hypothetical protein JKY94_09855 [Rhodobacteraceae bacterium]|nr:hypothetical protein [Paracoccaceae bacterium]
MTIVSSEDLKSLIDQVRALRTDIHAIQMQPKPRWITISEYATKIHRSRRTITRAIAAGKLETKEVCGVTLIETPG